MRSQVTKLASPKTKPAQSQSPLHKKKFYKFVNDNTNAKAEKTMQEQQLHERFQKEPPKEKKEDFKIEIDRRFQKSLTNQTYKFPKTDVSSDSISDTSRDSLDRLITTGSYDLHSQNLRQYAKHQRNAQKSASLGHQAANRVIGSHPVKGTIANVEKNAKKAHSNEPIKNIIKQAIQTEGSETQNKILELLEKNLENASKASSVTTKVSETSDKRQEQKTTQKDTNPNPEDQQEHTSQQKASIGSSPKQINFSLNVHVNNTKVYETKNVYNVTNIKNINHYHSIQDSKALSKSTKDLTAGLQPSSTRNQKSTMQNPQNGKKSNMSSATTTVTTMTTSGSTKTVKVPLENPGGLTTSISLQNAAKEPLKKAPTQSKSNTINANGLSQDKSQPSLRASDTERYFSTKPMNDTKTTDSKSFVSAQDNGDLPSSRGQSTDKLKKTTTLYNKAQNDLIKKLKLNTSPTASTATTEPSQGDSVVNIQKFLQGPVTATNRNSTPKTPARNLISSRMTANTMSNTNLNAHLKKPEQKMPAGKTVTANQVEIKSLTHLKNLIEKKSVELTPTVVQLEVPRNKTPKPHSEGIQGNATKTPSSRVSATSKMIESTKLNLDLKALVQLKGGALSERNNVDSKPRKTKKLLTEW